MNNTTQSDLLFKMGRISRKLFSARPRGHQHPAGRMPLGNSPTDHIQLGNSPTEHIRLGRTQGMLLNTIVENPDISQDELAAKLQLDKTTIAKAVKKMEISGVITREKSTEDARKYMLRATDKAEEIQEHIAKIRAERSSLAFEGIEQSELEAFSNTLDKIEANIERNRMKLNRRPFEHIGSIIDILTKEEGITQLDLQQKIGMDDNMFEHILSGLTNRGLVEEKDGKLYATPKAIDMKENGRGKMMSRPRGGRGHHRGNGRSMHHPHE